MRCHPSYEIAYIDEAVNEIGEFHFILVILLGKDKSYEKTDRQAEKGIADCRILKIYD